jgi:prepilin-type N-terminal cleavage/methylation domain-containing protein
MIFKQQLFYKKASGFTIIETMIVLAIAGLILLIVLLAVPSLERAARNNARKHDVALIQTELTTYYDENHEMPGPYTGGVCFEYDVIPAPGECQQSVTDYFTGLLPELSSYKNIDQFFYATDFGQGFAGWCGSNPTTCTNGARNISNVVPDPDDIFIDSSSVCVGNDQEAWTTSNQYNEIIAYALESSSGPIYQCIDVLGAGVVM